MTDKLRQAAQQAVAILGPEAPLCSGCVEEWAEALRILNEALAEQPAKPAEQEPVAWRGYTITNGYTLHFHYGEAHRVASKIDPLYTAPKPAKRVPLTDEELRNALRSCPHDTVENLRVRWLYAKDFARAIERAHGIGEQE